MLSEIVQVLQKSILNLLYQVTQNVLLRTWVALTQLFILIYKEKRYVKILYPVR